MHISIFIKAIFKIDQIIFLPVFLEKTDVNDNHTKWDRNLYINQKQNRNQNKRYLTK